MPFVDALDGHQLYYEVKGNPDGPNVFLGPHFYASPNPFIEAAGMTDPTPGWVEGLGERYRLILADYPPGMGKTPWTLPDDFTPDRAVEDYCLMADAAGAGRFAWVGYSFGGLMGLQVGCRSNRLSALVCGGWPALNGPYAKMLADHVELMKLPPPPDMDIPEGLGEQTITFLRYLQDWPEREAVAAIECPCLTFMGGADSAAPEMDMETPLAELLRTAQPDLEALGWSVVWLEDQDHLGASMPEVAVPVVRDFLDSVLSN